MEYTVEGPFQDQYADLLQLIHSQGDEVAPRGQPTREVLAATITFKEPEHVTLLGMGRYWSRALAAAEALQLVGGFSDPQMMVSIQPKFQQFIDNGSQHGAYGPRVRMQMGKAIVRLRADPHSRQAIVQIWDPLRDLFTEGIHDYPCTLTIQFLIRKKRLVTHVHMRSNDAWLGLGYDAFQFANLHLTAARCLDVEAGNYIHHANSLHIYERDHGAIEKLTAPTELPKRLVGIGEDRHAGQPWEVFADRARDICGAWERTPSPTEDWLGRAIELHI